MKAERTVPKQEFVPVIVTLESQEEVDSLFAIGNDVRMCNIFPALNRMYEQLHPFADTNCRILWDKLDTILR